MLPQLDPLTWRLETERLILRALQPGDAAAVNAAVCESFTELHRWMPWARARPALAESEMASKRCHEEFRAGRDFPVRLWLRDGTFVGSSSLHRGNPAVPSLEISYWGRTSVAGNGYICATALALRAFSFTEFGLQRLQIRCDARNAGSRRVAENAGSN